MQCDEWYSRFKHLCNRKAARTKTTGAVNLISHGQLCINSLYSSTRVVFKVVWLLQGCLNLLYHSSHYMETFGVACYLCEPHRWGLPSHTKCLVVTITPISTKCISLQVVSPYRRRSKLLYILSLNYSSGVWCEFICVEAPWWGGPDSLCGWSWHYPGFWSLSQPWRRKVSTFISLLSYRWIWIYLWDHMECPAWLKSWVSVAAITFGRGS